MFYNKFSISSYLSMTRPVKFKIFSYMKKSERQFIKHKEKKKIYVLQVSALKNQGMVGRHNILFCQSILYRNCILKYIFSPFSSEFDNILLTIHNRMFRVGAKT